MENLKQFIALVLAQPDGGWKAAHASPMFLKALSAEENPDQLVLRAEAAGDPGVYQEIAVSVLSPGGECLADIVIGLGQDGKPRVLCTSGGAGDGEKAVAVFPLRAKHEAVEIW